MAENVVITLRVPRLVIWKARLLVLCAYAAAAVGIPVDQERLAAALKRMYFRSVKL